MEMRGLPAVKRFQRLAVAIVGFSRAFRAVRMVRTASHFPRLGKGVGRLPTATMRRP
jgi:hypothetical protein